MQRSAVAGSSKVWRIPRFHDLELLHGTHLTQSFPRHTHDRYAIGVMEHGALGYFYRGKNIVATAGHVTLCIPNEVHTGQPATAGGWSYRMFYLEPAMLQRIASEIADRPRNLPFFQAGAIDDVASAQRIRQLHSQLEKMETPLLQQQSDLLDVLAQFIRRYADDPPPLCRPGREPRAVKQIKRYIEEYYSEDISLGSLSRLTQLSRYYLIRVFREATGIPPHAYLRQVRIKCAKSMLAAGHPIADVAVATGFTDQSHLTRWCKRLCGFTPGQYRNSVQDGASLTHYPADRQ